MRSIALPDGSISSSFLEMFGRPPRDTGLESERNNRPTADQRLHLLNSSHIQLKLEQSRMIPFLVQSNKTPREIATALYLGILSRFPTADELKIAEAYYQSGEREQASSDDGPGLGLDQQQRSFFTGIELKERPGRMKKKGRV